MALGQAAGTAAHLAIEGQKEPREIDVDKLQQLLIEKGQILTYFKDLDLSDPAHRAGQYFGTKGFFKDYFFRTKETLDRALADEWIGKILPRRKLPLSTVRTVSQAEVESLLPGLRAYWRRLPNTTIGAAAPVLRGEFCGALYEWLQSIHLETKPTRR